MYNPYVAGNPVGGSPAFVGRADVLREVLRGLLASDPRRLQFAFVIGRNVDDLANIALSLFKGTPYQRVSLLNYKDTAACLGLHGVSLEHCCQPTPS